jgi:hypothetical protein
MRAFEPAWLCAARTNLGTCEIQSALRAEAVRQVDEQAF